MAPSYSYSKLSLVMSLMVVTVAMTNLKADAQFLRLVSINGVLFCSANGSVTGSPTPVFINATVQLQCVPGTVVSTSVTNGSGAFSFLLNPLQLLLSTLLGTCRLRVATPLTACNATLSPTGVLTSALQLSGNIIAGLVNITQLVPSGFHLVNNI
ncbi:hypothetical protein SAY86_029939 [Trapa natans]|uniref:Phylloplanin-like n=1 Tax=Trapa natans TaxID=22666 RepID=A0AAN7RHU5_TRANT|nr:hypothetical protein SAY86_029939 [Trapa natans]